MTSAIEIESFFDLKDFPIKKLWEKSKYPWSPLYLLEEFLLNFVEYHPLIIPNGVYLKNAEKVFIGKNTIIAPGAYIEGPCFIGNNCDIRHGAWIRPNTIICDQVVIGHATEVKQSLIFPEARIPHFSYIGDSIIGRGVNIGAGVVCANCRLDKKAVSLNLSGTVYPTNLKKLGAIIGDGASIGCNTLLNPGTLIGKGASCFPSLTLYGWVPPHSIVKTNLQHSCRGCE